MSEELIEPIPVPSVDTDSEETESYWDATETEIVANSEREHHLPTTSTSGDGDAADVGADGDGIDVGIDNGDGYDDGDADGGGDTDLVFSSSIDMPEYRDKLKVIHDRITRIVNRISFLTQSLKQVHQGLKNYTNERAEEQSLPNIESKKAMGDNGSTQTDPLIKPELNMLAERTGDSVACQTIEDNPFAD